MDSRMGAALGDMNNYEPSTDLIQEDECDTLVLYLPGFKKEQLRVQLTSGGTLRISGARPIEENKSSSFQKTFPISANCDTNKITAKFEEGILYVRQPKLIVPAGKEDNKIPPPETVRPPTPAVQRPPPKVDQQALPEKTTSSNDQYRKTGVADFPGQSDEIKDKNSPKEAEKRDRMKDGNKDGNKYEQEKTDRVDYGQQVAGGTTSDKRDADMTDKGTQHQDKGKNIPGITTSKFHDIDGVDGYNLNAGSPAAKLKMTGRMISAVLVVLFAFLLGMHVSNLPWFPKTPGN